MTTNGNQMKSGRRSRTLLAWATAPTLAAAFMVVGPTGISSSPSTTATAPLVAPPPPRPAAT